MIITSHRDFVKGFLKIILFFYTDDGILNGGGRIIKRITYTRIIFGIN